MMRAQSCIGRRHGAWKRAREEDEERGEGIRDARERDSGQPLAVCPSVRLYITCKRLGY